MESEIKVLIIDDDTEVRHELTRIINKSKRGFTVCGQAGDILNGLKEIGRLHPDLLILDVEMPGGCGFELLECLPHMDLPVIFIAEEGLQAIRAFRYNALDFLLKPIDSGFLLAALEKAKSKVSAKAEVKKKVPLKLAIHSHSEIEYVEIRSIIRLEADGCYTQVYLENGRKITVSKALREYEGLLLDEDFTRVHNSHVINMHHVRKFVKKDGFMVKMTGDCCVPIAVRRKEIFEQKLKSVAI